jgi:polysaccharide biosynthesis protein VpsQ
MILIGRYIITIIPFVYMYLIWQQTSNFDPESVSDLSKVLNPYVILSIGAVLELGHLFEFGILYFILIMAFLAYGHLKKWKEAVILIISLSYGLIDEIHQLYVPFRSFSIMDLIKNTIGIIVIAILIHKNYFTSKETRFGLFLRNGTNYFKKDNAKVDF